MTDDPRRWQVTRSDGFVVSLHLRRAEAEAEAEARNVAEAAEAAATIFGNARYVI
jgi:hypothetical protein